jgi:hypothetical protein
MSSHAIYWPITTILSMPGAVHAFGARRWIDFLGHPTAVLITAGLCLAALVLLIGFGLRIVVPRRALVISNFEMPKDGALGLT